MAFVERRAFPRLSLKVEVEYRTVSVTEESGSLKAQGKDISAGGIRLVTLENLEIGTSLDLTFLLPDSAKPISATGRVAWKDEYMIGTLESSKAYDVGVEFISINLEDKEKIKQCVFSRLQ